MKNVWKNTATDALFDTILQLRNRTEAQDFFRDLLTEAELLEFANRYQVARMLTNNVPYSQIERETGMSSTTIARISKWLKTGTGGYARMIERSSSQTTTLMPILKQNTKYTNTTRDSGLETQDSPHTLPSRGEVVT